MYDSEHVLAFLCVPLCCVGQCSWVCSVGSHVTMSGPCGQLCPCLSLPLRVSSGGWVGSQAKALR